MFIARVTITGGFHQFHHWLLGVSRPDTGLAQHRSSDGCRVEHLLGILQRPVHLRPRYEGALPVSFTVMWDLPRAGFSIHIVRVLRSKHAGIVSSGLRALVISC